MADPEPILALRRKLGSAANPFSLAGMRPPKALRLAFARACENVARFEAAVSDFAEDRISLAQVVEDLNHFDLIQSIKATTGATGLAIWDGQALSAFVEQLITGRIVPSEAEGRVATSTDSALISGVLDAILTGFDAELEQSDGVPSVRGFKVSGIFSDGRAVSMALNDLHFRRYKLALALGGGVKTGQLQLIFPCDGGSGKNPPGPRRAAWKATWRHAVSDAKAPVQAILHRLSMPLQEISEFEVGTLVPIPTTAIGKVSLEGLDQRSAAAGRLGQSNGYRAVRVATSSGQADMAGNQVPFENTQTQAQLVAPPPAASGTHENVDPHQQEEPTHQAINSADAKPKTIA